MKKIIAILLSLSMLLLLAACGGGASSTAEPQTPASTGGDSTAAPAADGEKVICYSFGPMTGGAAWGQFEKGFYQACEELGWEGHYLAPTADNNMSELMNLHETAITNGANVMLPLVVDHDAMADILINAREQGITLYGVAASDDNLDGFIGTDSQNLGYNIAEALVKVAGDGPINVVTMQSLLSTQQQVEQVDAFVEHLAELRPDAVVVSREECNSSAQTAQDKLSAVCIAHPETNALVSFDSYAGLGAASYCVAEGVQDDFFVIGIDDAAEILLAIKDGSMDATVAQMWYKMGYEGVMNANKIRNGEEVPFATDAGTAIVMPEDVDSWAEQVGADLG